MRKTLERNLKSGIFASRWLLAPFYAGLSLSLLLLLITFLREFLHFIPEALDSSPSYVIVTVLSLVDIVMVANLVLLIVFAGYEIFVSKIDISDNEDRPDWMGLVSFSDLKIKLMGTIVAISGIELLKTFVNIKGHDQTRLTCGSALTSPSSYPGVLFALMDRICERAWRMPGDAFADARKTPQSPGESTQVSHDAKRARMSSARGDLFEPAKLCFMQLRDLDQPRQWHAHIASLPQHLPAAPSRPRRRCAAFFSLFAPER